MSNKESDLLQVVQRIVNLTKELVADLNQRIKANLLQLPKAIVFRDSVRLDKTQDSMLAVPALLGKALSDNLREDWKGTIKDRCRLNRKETGKALEKCLKSLRPSQKHVRMRVNFGRLAFKRYQLPSGGAESYGFEEFCAMFANDRTMLELRGLPYGTATPDFVDTCSSHQSFSDGEESYSVYFDFQQPDKVSILRLENELRPAQGGKELEVSQQRWLELRSGGEDSPLEVNMLDFEELDWQLSIKSTRFYDNKMTIAQMSQFQRSIGFKASSDGIKATPRRRAIFAGGVRGPSRVTELTTVKYRFKDTDGKFELTRKDEYDESPQQTKSLPVTSTWSASYYYPEWDNLLGEYAYIQPGEQVTWQPSLAAFFPPRNGEAASMGFKKFIEEVKELQKIFPKDTKKSIASGNAPSDLTANLSDGAVRASR